MPSWATEIIEHDTSLGTIEWDKEKFKDALYLDPIQLFGSRTGSELLNKFKNQQFPILNASVFDYLLDNTDQIPEEWKQDEKSKTKHIFFWGTIFRMSKTDLRVPYLYWSQNESTWLSNFNGLEVDFFNRDFAAVLPKKI